MKHKVSELSGALLDAAVAKAAGVRISFWGDTPIIEGGGGMPGGNVTSWEPSSNWAQGGPLIERAQITTGYCGHKNTYWPGQWLAQIGEDHPNFHSTGPTPLIAAMRAYCASVHGEYVELP